MHHKRDLSATEGVYDAIVSFTADNNKSPTQQEIAAIVGKGRTAVCKHIVHLVDAGRIRLIPGKRRGIVVVK